MLTLRSLALAMAGAGVLAGLRWPKRRHAITIATRALLWRSRRRRPTRRRARSRARRQLVTDGLAHFHVGLADQIIGGREPAEVGHSLQVPDDDAWFHADLSMTHALWVGDRTAPKLGASVACAPLPPGAVLLGDGTLVAWYRSLYAPRHGRGRMTVTIGRRELLAALGGAAMPWPLAARAQQTERVRRVGVLSTVSPAIPWGKAAIDALAQGLSALGWKEG